MELNEFIENFANQFDDTEASVFTPETKFRDLDEWSSLIALSVIAMIDEEYDVTINGEDMKSATTVQDLFNIVNSRV